MDDATRAELNRRRNQQLAAEAALALSTPDPTPPPSMPSKSGGAAESVQLLRRIAESQERTEALTKTMKGDIRVLRSIVVILTTLWLIGVIGGLMHLAGTW